MAVQLSAVPRVLFEATWIDQALVAERYDGGSARGREVVLRSPLRGASFRRALQSLGSRPLTFTRGRGSDGTQGGLEVWLLEPGVARVRWPLASRAAVPRRPDDPSSETQRAVRAHCLRMVEAHPAALEISVRNASAHAYDFGWPAARDAEGALPSAVRFISHRLEGRGAELRLVREVTVAQGLLPEVDAGAPTVLTAAGLPAFAMQALLLSDVRDAATDVTREREGHVLRLRARFAYADLRLLSEDRALLRRAMRATARPGAPTPADRVDVTNLEQVRLQVRRWATYAATQQGDRRRAVLEQQLRLLQAALPHHPAEGWLYDRVCELTLDALEAPQTCVTWAERGIQVEPLLRASLQLWVRRASARLSDVSLAEALVAHEVVPRPRAKRVAAALVSLVRLGAAYDAAEGAYLAAEMLAAEPRPRLRTVSLDGPDEGWPLESLPRVAAWLLSGVRAKAAGLYVRLSGDAVAREPEEVLLRVQQLVDPEAPSPQLMPVLNGEGEHDWIVALHASDERAQHALGDLLHTLMTDGAIEVQISLVPLERDGEESASTLLVHGAVRGGAVYVRRVGMRSTRGRAVRAPWAKVSSLLAIPLVSHVPRTFPMPEISLRTKTPDEAFVLSERLESESGASCRVSGPQISCRAHPERPTALIAAYRAFVMPQLVSY